MDPRTWKTSPDSSQHRSLPHWKKPLGEVCPHGYPIFLVDGTFVRNHFESDFTQGGNGYAYPKFMSKKELWIDWHIPQDEWAYVTFHECHEAEDMRRGMSYDKAHDRAKGLEDKMRRQNFPGER